MKKDNIKALIIAIVLIGIIIGLGILVSKQDKEFIKSCQEAGYSYNYCELHK